MAWIFSVAKPVLNKSSASTQMPPPVEPTEIHIHANN